MFGWRASIGYVCPSVFELIAQDFYRICPPGVGMIGVTCMINGWDAASYERGLSALEEAVRELARRRADFIIHAGVPLVVTHGKGFDRELVRRIEAVGGVPATTSIRAAMDALRELGAGRIALVTPYPADLNASVVGYLQDEGFDVAQVVSLESSFTELRTISPARIYRAACQAVRGASGVEAVYMPCPQFPVLDVLETMEQDLGVPVVAHLPAELWAAFRRVGVRPVEGWGMLLRRL